MVDFRVSQIHDKNLYFFVFLFQLWHLVTLSVSISILMEALPRQVSMSPTRPHLVILWFTLQTILQKMEYSAAYIHNDDRSSSVVVRKCVSSEIVEQINANV